MDAANASPSAGRRSRYEGIVVRHARSCGSRVGGRYSCRPSYQAQVWSGRERKTIRKTFRELGEARAWRHESQVAIRNGLLRSPSQTTLVMVAGRSVGTFSLGRDGIAVSRCHVAVSPSRWAFRRARFDRLIT
jgi:hypothetical protein